MTRVLGKLLRRMLLAWALLALASLAFRAVTDRPADNPADAALPDEVRAVSVPRGDGALRVAYRTWGDPARPCVLLLHGSPGRGEHLRHLGEALADRFYAVAPDLPGFGLSTQRVPDMGIDALAGDVLGLLDALGLPRAHVVGFSLGGGVALHLWERAPERVASLTLLSSIGVQEMELLGDHTLNRGLHLAQLGVLRALDLAVPHFGTTDLFRRGVLYARSFSESDQRPLRALLRRYDGPALVIHGEDDILVPVEAAREHLRLLPQAEAWIAPSSDEGFGAADHFMVFRSRPPFAGALIDFLQRAEAGLAPRRADATPERTAAAARRFDPESAPPARGPFLVLLVVLIALATLVSEDLTCVGAGLLAASGRLSFAAATGGSLVGIFVGDMLLFLGGRWLGRPAVRRAPLRWLVDEATLDRGAAWFTRRGARVIFISRFVPGMRLPTYLAAGLLGTGVLRFAGWFLAASLAWTPALVGLSMLAGHRVLQATDWMAQHSLLAFGLILLALLVVTRLIPPLFSHRGRRTLLGRWLRLRHWEFWPMWALYPPVVLWIGWLALRHRSLAVVTAVNPGIPAGGIIGESKSDILRRLAGDGSTDPRAHAPTGAPTEGGASESDPPGGDLPHAASLPRTSVLPAGEELAARVARVDAFRARHALGWPIVLKPDAGQRGSGVKVCHDDHDVRAWLAEHPVPMLAQEYVAGDEYGVFWYRLPGAARGTLYSVTHKRMPTVTGDGSRNLERLILDDPRAVALAHAYAELLLERLEEVPPPGVRVPLTELGTHCRGAVFEDAGELATDALRDAVDAMADGFEGFCFGRFDLRAPSREALAQGRGLNVIELNGLTSEATHIYDRRHTVGYAWRVLCRQWSIAFAIGAANRAAGAPVTPLRAVIAMALDYRRAQRASPLHS